MSTKSFSVPVCDNHHDDVAQAICLNHQTLLCLSCAFEKAKSTECSFTDLKKISGQKDTLLLEFILLRQTVSRKIRLIEEHESKTTGLENKMEKEVIELHDKLTQRLNEMKKDCLTTIENGAKAITAASSIKKQRIASFQDIVNDNIAKLADKSDENLNDFQSNLEKVKKEVIEKIPDKIPEPEGIFMENDSLCSLILQSNTGLGNIYLNNPDLYDEVDNVLAGTHECIPKSKLYVGSDVICKPAVENPEIKHSDPSKISPDEKSERNSTSSENFDFTLPGENSKKKNGRFFSKLFSSDKKKGYKLDEEQQKGVACKKDEQKTISAAVSGKQNLESIYQYSTFNMPSKTQPKYLINKTVKVLTLNQHFTSACKFTKLVDLGDARLAMLSPVHSMIVFTTVDGQLSGKKTIKEGNKNIVATGTAEVAIISEPGLTVTKFKEGDKNVLPVGSFIVDEEIDQITGFDYDKDMSKFAVSSTNKVVVLDESGKKLKAVPYGTITTQASNEVTTAFDFNKERLFYLNVTDKTLKMFSLEKTYPLWQYKFDGESAMPRNLCLYKDKLCIACGDIVAVFSATSGHSIAKHDTNDLLADNYGICVIDDVIVISSNSEDFEKSITLAYISL